MAPRVSPRPWRDMPIVFVLCIWVAFGLSLLFFVSDWPRARNNVAKTAKSVVTSSKADDDEIYTGSIITFPPTGNRCSELRMDNRTGKMWDNGYVNCDAIVSELVNEKRQESFDLMRLRTISNVFRHEKN
jgi:hypothetical protein